LRAVSRALGLETNNRTLTTLDEVLAVGTQVMGQTGTQQQFSTPSRDQVMGTAVGQELRGMAEQAGTAQEFAAAVYAGVSVANGHSVGMDMITGSIGERIARANNWTHGDVAGLLGRLTAIQDTGVASIEEFYITTNPTAAAASAIAREQAAVRAVAEQQRRAEAAASAAEVIRNLTANGEPRSCAVNNGGIHPR
jgi:hypothetical protein